MKRKEIRAISITQSNDAKCHNPRPNGHKARKSIRRTSSKKVRQAVSLTVDQQLLEHLENCALDVLHHDRDDNDVEVAYERERLREGFSKVLSTTGRSDPLKPGIGLLVKLGSIAAHTDELLSPGGHEFDKVAIDGLLRDPEVQNWMADMTKMAMLPVKRRGA